MKKNFYNVFSRVNNIDKKIKKSRTYYQGSRAEHREEF